MSASATSAARPDPDEYPPSFKGYVSLVPEGDVVENLSRQITDTLALLRSVSEEKGNYRYEPGKWSIKEVVGHTIDTERIFNYRALCFARGDRTPLPGMDQDEYMVNTNFNALALGDLADEFEQVRRATIYLFRHMDAAAWARRGIANNNEASVRAMAYIIAGHEAHHVGVLRTKYL